jgi:tRNA(Ile)-lysidine synthase
VSVFDIVASTGLLAPGRPVVAMLSGGRDSVCLLDLAVRIAGPGAVSALHVNYGLRDTADIDEELCRSVCVRLGVPLEVRHSRRPETGNLQAWARAERYGAAAQLALARGADVAAGHTATDQVETILYRLASSPSRRALLGMSGREGLLVRPLLGVTREQTAEYCSSRALPWREDETNDSAAFARSRIRARLVPALLEVHPGAHENVLALAEILRGEAEVLGALVDDALAGRQEIELARLRELPAPVARLVVQRLADDAAGGLASGVARRTAELIELGGRGTMELDVGSGLRAVVEYGLLRFSALATSPAPSREAVRLPVPGSVLFAGQEIRCEVGPPAREPGVLDRRAVGADLLVRSWRSGDRMEPLGLNGSKSLQDLFTAMRVPRRARPGIAIVESGGEIAWVAGVATSERFKVTDSTVEAVHLSARPA